MESLGFRVKDLRETLAKLESIQVRPTASTATTATLVWPEKIHVELRQDPWGVSMELNGGVRNMK